MNDVLWNQNGAGLVVMARDDPEKRTTGKGTAGKLKPSGKLNREIQAELGEQLRQMYNDVVEEGVPDKFSNLLAQLEKSDGDKDRSPK